MDGTTHPPHPAGPERAKTIAAILLPSPRSLDRTIPLFVLLMACMVLAMILLQNGIRHPAVAGLFMFGALGLNAPAAHTWRRERGLWMLALLMLVFDLFVATTVAIATARDFRALLAGQARFGWPSVAMDAATALSFALAACFAGGASYWNFQAFRPRGTAGGGESVPPAPSPVPAPRDPRPSTLGAHATVVPSEREFSAPTNPR